MNQKANVAGQKTAERILDAACACVRRDGYAASNLVAIRKAADVTTGSIYHAFEEGRAQIMAAVYTRWAAELESQIAQVALVKSRSLDDFLAKRLLPAYCQWFAAERHRAAFMFEFEVLATGTQHRMAVNGARDAIQDLIRRKLAGVGVTEKFGIVSPALVEAVVLGPARRVIAVWALANTGAPTPMQQVPGLAKASAAALHALFGD